MIKQNSAERATIYLNTKEEWRFWLENNHHIAQSIWVICNTKKSNLPVVNWTELVDEALCFGWIDSTRRPIDAYSFMQLFSRRKPNSTWSKINKEKVKKLIDANLMTPAGHEVIKIAQENGSWSILDSVEELIIPQDLDEAFQYYAGSKDYFLGLSKSVKKMMLQWIVLAKRPDTRKKRIDEIVARAAEKDRPKQFQ
ncbi:YdeI/OmpD-associated family protein [Sphingobacterium sp. UGAL515B_05]|uniref:YdeI/OmpD-associated family protein n=1 Tax=Sphingobacterium sp. UGAL515B_05 TaxID=2986767 RepID=UPI002954E934|nr:YdeI/OmpD-associated family protein [Sphingobacterium sp. UGAL515B_05]WON94294.1 YdeI/OmpD-associated family protein [Sphingobacterium sp. UGAL515B_05]